MSFNYTVTDLRSGKSKKQIAESTSEALIIALADTLNVSKSSVHTQKNPSPNFGSSYQQFLVIGKDYTPHFYSVIIDRTTGIKVKNLDSFVKKFSSKGFKRQQDGSYYIKGVCLGGGDYDDPCAWLRENPANGTIDIVLDNYVGNRKQYQLPINDMKALYNFLSDNQLF